MFHNWLFLLQCIFRTVCVGESERERERERERDVFSELYVHVCGQACVCEYQKMLNHEAFRCRTTVGSVSYRACSVCLSIAFQSSFTVRFVVTSFIYTKMFVRKQRTNQVHRQRKRKRKKETCQRRELNHFDVLFEK